MQNKVSTKMEAKMPISGPPSASDDQPLPHGMANKLAGWASVARQYPIYSQTWFAYRMRSFMVPLLILALLLVLVALFAPGTAVPPGVLYGGLLAAWLVVALGLGLGRALAVLVCLQKWRAPREAAGVICALLIGVLAALALTPLTRVQPPPDPARVATAHEVEIKREREREGRVVNLVVWLIVLAWLGGTVDLVAYFRQRRMLRDALLLGQVRRYKDERDEVELQLSVLASQIEPHFLFNTLSGVRAAMLSDPARGIVLIDHLVDYLRSTIPQLRADRAHKFVALGAQLDAVQAYLGIIAARLPRLRVRIDCPSSLREVAIPPLMLISLVENAVKHGIELKQGPAQIIVTAARGDDGGEGEGDAAAMLQLSVSDDGVGFGATSSGSGIGLSNIRARLLHLYDGQASLSLRAGDNGGVVASIVLPLRAMPPGDN